MTISAGSHLFEFLAGEGRCGIPDPDGDFGPQPIDARKTRLSNIVQETGAKTSHYLYDFGDSWDHVIKLETWFDNTSTDGLPFLLDAAGRCPPEDVGGAPGYAEYLDAIGDPAHPEHEQMRLWGLSGAERASGETAIDVFAEKYRAKFSRAVGCLLKYRNSLLAFLDFPAEHRDHLRTNNSIESVFATVRHRTVRTKGTFSPTTARLMVFKLVIAASRT